MKATWKCCLHVDINTFTWRQTLLCIFEQWLSMCHFTKTVGYLWPSQSHLPYKTNLTDLLGCLLSKNQYCFCIQIAWTSAIYCFCIQTAWASAIQEPKYRYSRFRSDSLHPLWYYCGTTPMTRDLLAAAFLLGTLTVSLILSHHVIPVIVWGWVHL